MPTKKLKKEINSYSQFFELFAGNLVNVVIKNANNINEDGENTGMMVQGYFLDECNDYYYLGEDPLDVSAAIKKTEVIAFINSKDENPYDIMPEGRTVN